LKAPTLKAGVVYSTEGSNPSLSCAHYSNKIFIPIFIRHMTERLIRIEYLLIQYCQQVFNLSLDLFSIALRKYRYVL
jgi:hypothetical protein